MDKRKNEETNIGIGDVILGLAGVALGVGGKMLIDSMSKPEEEKEESEMEEEIKNRKEVEDIVNNLYKKGTEEESYICPLSHKIMVEPVITPYGITFERSYIESYIEKEKKCPLTNRSLSKDDLIANYALKGSIEEYKKRNNISI